jgi:periplasmic copper chaperone A
VRARALLLTLCVGALLAGCGASPGVQVRDPWARPTPAMATMGAAYMTITSVTGDRLTAVHVPPSIADRAEIHEVLTDSLGAMRMQPVSGVDLPAGEPVTFRPGAWHVMLIGIRRPLVAGESFEMTLRFVHSRSVEARVRVRGM